MFKSVEYAGFEGRPELEAKARHANDVLGGVIRSWRDQVEVMWRPADPSTGAALELALALALPTASGSAVGTLGPRDFESTLPGALRMPLSDVWMGLLDTLLAQMAARREAALVEPVGA